MTQTTLNFDRLLKIRLVVARFGEMDLARWWNTRGQLGRLGASAVQRGFPRTHYFAQARSVFAVAAHRCHEIFDPPDSVTLWQLPEAIEEEFEAKWEIWLDRANEWQPFFRRLESSGKQTLRSHFKHLMLSLTINPKCLRDCAVRRKGGLYPYPSHSRAPIRMSHCSLSDSHAVKLAHS